MQNNNGGTTKYRVSVVEETLKELSKKVDLIRTNELPHINSALASLKVRVTIATAINIGAIMLLSWLQR